LNWFEIV